MLPKEEVVMIGLGGGSPLRFCDLMKFYIAPIAFPRRTCYNMPCLM